MAEISAGLVMKLRKMSGQGMMDCKKALEESNADIEEAMTLLRKKGLATLEKRAGRETPEGKVVCKAGDDGRTVVLTLLCCETDFVAGSDDFSAAIGLLTEYAFACPLDEGVDSILETAVGGRKFSEVITEIVSKTGEKMKVGDYAKYRLKGSGVIGSYVHFNSRVGAMVEIEANDDKVAEALQRTAVDIAMHITATSPITLDKEGIDAKTIEREKAIVAEQVKNKPANIIEKIVEGKMRKFFAENCLIEQSFIKDEKKTVGEILNDAAKSTGGEAKIKRFVRFEIG